MIQLLIYVVPTLVLLGMGVCVGGFRERRHLASLARREGMARDVILTNLKRLPDEATIRNVALVGGQVVIATDYFKTFATVLRNLMGGEMRAAQTLLLRARREAVLRMIGEARQLGAKEIYNVRFAFCNITQMSGNKGAMAVEIYAYGTAIVREQALGHVQA